MYWIEFESMSLLISANRMPLSMTTVPPIGTTAVIFLKIVIETIIGRVIKTPDSL